jgi:hypothetical protein
VADQAELWLHIVTKDPGPKGRSSDSDWRGETITGSHDWTRHEVTAQVPGDTELIRFGLTLTGPGQVGLIPGGYPAPVRGAGHFHVAQPDLAGDQLDLGKVQIGQFGAVR